MLPPLSLYIHTPWCRAKCPYCDFNSHNVPDNPPQREYIRALLVDLRSDLALLHKTDTRPIRSVFIGGGTPSLLDTEALCALLEGVRKLANLSPDCEITMEANPESADIDKLKALNDLGVNRLSLGVQSFDDTMLAALGRVHNARAATLAFENARRAGFSNINIDLMFALPDQNMRQCEKDIRHLISLAPEHVSLYQLTLEPNTLFHAQPPPLPNDDEAWRMEQHARQTLAENGWRRYEVSAHARTGQECAHNINYWQFGDYFGIGAGAHGKLTTNEEGCLRLVKRRHPTDYIRGIRENNAKALSEKRRLNKATLIFEFMLNATRLIDGFDRRLFETTTGLPFSEIDTHIKRLESRNLVEATATRVRPTALGLRFLNEIQCEFLSAESDIHSGRATYRLAFFDDSTDGLSLSG